MSSIPMIFPISIAMKGAGHAVVPFRPETQIDDISRAAYTAAGKNTREQFTHDGKLLPLVVVHELHPPSSG
jgi:hypothetical protein